VALSTSCLPPWFNRSFKYEDSRHTTLGWVYVSRGKVKSRALSLASLPLRSAVAIFDAVKLGHIMWPAPLSLCSAWRPKVENKRWKIPPLKFTEYRIILSFVDHFLIFLWPFSSEPRRLGTGVCPASSLQERISEVSKAFHKLRHWTTSRQANHVLNSNHIEVYSAPTDKNNHES